MYPGYYYAPPADVSGRIGHWLWSRIGIGFLAHQGWGWGHWGMGWGSHAVFFNHGRYFTHSTTVINHGFNRPGGPGRNFGGRGAYASTFNRAGGGFNRSGYLGAYSANSQQHFCTTRCSNEPSFVWLPGAYSTNRSSSPSGSRGASNASRSGGNFSRPEAERASLGRRRAADPAVTWRWSPERRS